MKKIVEQAVKACIYLSFFVPLVMLPSSFIFPFIVPKVLILRSLIELMLGGYGLLLIINWQEYRPRFTPLNIALGVFLLSFFASTFAGVDSYHSFWDNHERMLGLFTIMHYVAYYFVASAVFKNWSEWMVALKVFLVAGSVVMLLGVFQRLVDDTLLLNQSGSRVASTLGNPIYVGGYGLFLFFVAFLLFMKEKNTLWRWLIGAMGTLAFLGMVFSGTRGSMFGFLAGLGAVAVGYALALKHNPKIRLTLGIVVAVGLMIFGGLYLNRTNPLVRNIPTLGNLLNSSLYSGTGSTRLIAWQIALSGWKERPIFGWGPNNFFYVFNKYYNPKSLEHGYGETWFDNAHNIVLNTLAVQGSFGLLAYLGIFAIGILVLWQTKEQRDRNPHLVVIGSAFLLAHLLHNVTVFEDPTSYLYFVFWLAMLNRLASAEAYEAPYPADRNTGSVSAVACGVVTLFAVCIFNYQPAKANMMTLETLLTLNRDPAAGSKAVATTLTLSSPHIDDIRSDLARETIQLLGANYSKLPADLSMELFNTMYAALKQNVELHPFDIRNYLYLGQFGQVGYLLTKDLTYMVEAEKYLSIGLSYTPRRQQFLYTLGNIKLQLGKANEAAQLLQQALNDNPRIAESYWRLAYIYHLAGQPDQARFLLLQAHEKGLTFDSQGQQVEKLIWATSTVK